MTFKQIPAASASTGLLIILLCAMGAGPLFNYGVSVSSALIIEQLGITAGQLGLIVTVVFASAAISSIWLGNLADKISARAQMAIIFTGTAVALVMAAFAHSYWLLLAAAALSGPAQAISNATTNRVIIRAVPVEKQAGWIGVKQSGVQASQLFSGLLFPAVALALGWTGAALGGALVCVLLWFASFKYVPSPAKLAASNSPAPVEEPPEVTVETDQVSAVNTKDKMPAIVYFFAVIAMLSGMGTQATNVYLPLFAVEELNFSLVLGGVAAAVSGIIGVVSRLAWSRQMQAGAQPSRLLIMISLGAIFGVLAFLGAAMWQQTVLVWVGAALHGMTVLGANVVINAGLLRAVPGSKIGAASGLNSMGMYAGFALGPLVMGGLQDLTHSFTAGWMFVGVSYVACGVVAVMLYRRRGRNEKRS
ncbi:MFS transporter [Enteractinococcus helveticum]|uniref:Arabinose ABC transporter permease n=1 Tax=Enteractinococcus helveticum TaxID=1837282 RepID=A0A1B7LV98_9MICC|nr:MFS transporter [Enteractinococcus helveticum]OAV52034.1 arabinose ABC transporter permease [Enteractinococcus helveticum]